MLEVAYVIILTITFTAWVALTLFKREMRNKSKYKHYIDDAIDGIENNFSSNNDYPTFSSSGVAFIRNNNNEIEAISQNKLFGTPIKY